MFASRYLQRTDYPANAKLFAHTEKRFIDCLIRVPFGCQQLHKTLHGGKLLQFMIFHNH